MSAVSCGTALLHAAQRRLWTRAVAPIRSGRAGCAREMDVSATMSSMSLLWRILLGNAAIVAAGVAVLAISPATVSFPVSLRQVAVLCAGFAAVLAVDYVFLRHAVGPLRRLAAVMREVDPLSPGRRADLPVASGEVSELAAAFDEMLERLELERRESARRALRAQEEERRRLARDLHDEVGQSLTAVLLLLDRAQMGVQGALGEPLREAREGVRSTLNEVRALARNLRPEALDELGLPAALRQLCTEAERAGLVVHRSIDSRLDLEPDTEFVVYRVAQEALTNALRHAHATAITLQLAATGAGVALSVCDDGRGMRGAVEGTGLRGMRERAVLVGGTLDVAPRDSGGTCVTLTIS
jgi:two-component system sensor histidine kinase UhpB